MEVPCPSGQAGNLSVRAREEEIIMILKNKKDETAMEEI